MSGAVSGSGSATFNASPTVAGVVAEVAEEESDETAEDVARVAREVAALKTHERTSAEFLGLFSMLAVMWPSKTKKVEAFYKKHTSRAWQEFALNFMRALVLEPEFGIEVSFDHPEEFGNWREATVTASFPDEKKVYVSDREFVKRGINGPPRKPKPIRSSGYSRVCIILNGIQRKYSLHYLIGRAWLGRLDDPGDTFDHKTEILKGGSNEPSNLKKATQSQQILKQKDKRAKSNGYDVFGRKKGDTEWKLYSSLGEAAKDTGVGTTTIRDLCFKKQISTSLPFEFKFDDSPDPDLPGEVWEAVKQETGPYKMKIVSNVLVSNMGRVQTRQSANSQWTRKYTKVASKGAQYASISIGGKSYPFHVVVFYTFFIGPIPKGHFVVDHKDMDKSNNCFSNLRLVSVSENSKNQEFRVAVATNDGRNFTTGNGVSDLARKMSELTEEKWVRATLSLHLAESNLYFYKGYWVFHEDNRSSFDEMISKFKRRVN